MLSKYYHIVTVAFVSLCFTVILLSPCAAEAQKFACINTDYVLKSIPDYAQAQKRIDKYVEEWQKELDAKYQELETLRQNFQQESYLLPDNLKKRREEELKEKNLEIVQLQQKYFGPGGDLDKKREEFLKPVQDRVYSTIERVAKEKNYAFVFDKSASSTVLFASEKYDITNQVLEMLGYKPGDNAAPDAKGNTSKSSPPKGLPSQKGNSKGTQYEPKKIDKGPKLQK